MTSTSPAPHTPRAAATDPVRLLRSWAPGRGSWLSGPRGSLLTRGTLTRPSSADPDAVVRCLREVDAGRPAGAEPALAVGALPFDPDAPAHLVVPERVERAAPLGTVLVAEPTGAPVSGVLRSVPAPERYEAMVAEALARMASDGLAKVVLARGLEVVADAPVDAVRMVRELAHRDPRSHLFAVDLPGDTPRTLLGASPELLVSREGADVVANPIAGSAARSPEPAEDRRRAEALLASVKDQHEHALVVADVAERLAPLVDGLEVPDAPSLVATPTLWHLSTELRGRVADPDVSALHLARALHPTPAVCGVPRAAAHTAITEIEPFDRGFYTGTVGWTDAQGDGEWVMALRCGEVEGDRVRLWAGAGIVPASRPADELAETAVKLRTLLDALGLDEA
ncbi:isochorismate synthase [Actinomycetospora cinnamomea]|uniref:isochorismate synthase n=1 Tax=Actinomycetospora cinnamomea TaxID=663609 RepID=A0A2U1FLH6_9PSEU|nr:isochorismate synthase [Actinomycetospora cinnamomea]PVZ12880.1 isochorismate synthase [Actinomycetospora cinnamomea]